MDNLLIKQRLKTLGFGDDLTLVGDIANDWGPKCIADLKLFQKAKGLVGDGIVGPKTIAALFPTSAPAPVPAGDAFHLKPLPSLKPGISLQIAAMQVAISQNGVRELTGLNDGPAVETYLASTGNVKGQSYCMAGVYWSYKTAADLLNVPNKLYRSGGVLNVWNNTPKEMKVKTPQPGDIAIMDLGGGHGHAFIVVSVSKIDNILTSVEFNTNAGGSSNGNGVYYPRQRPLNSPLIIGYIRVTG